MREVSAQAMALIFRIADGAKLDRATVREAFRMPPTADRLDWEDFAHGLAWLQSKIGDDQVLQDAAAANFADDPAHRGQIAAARLFASPRAVYWAMHKWGGHALFANVNTEYEVLGPRRLRFRIAVDRDAPPCFFVLCGGSLRACPSALGYPESAVRLEISARHCDYFVEHAVSHSIVARLWAVLRAFGSRRVVLEEFEEQKKALTDQLAELNLAHRQSQEALGMMARFLGTVTHELRTPLAGIIGVADLVRDNQLKPAEQEVLIADLRNSASRLLNIVNDVVNLDASTPHDMTPQARSLKSLMEGVVQPFAVTGAVHNVSIKLDIDPSLPPFVRLQPELLAKSLAPVLDNAVRFTERGSVHVRVTQSEDRKLVVRVADTGPGVPAGLQQRIFEAFFQVDQRLTRQHGGVGLGLAVARQLARTAGGDVRLEASSDQGSTFSVEWPFAAATAMEAELPRPVTGDLIQVRETSVAPSAPTGVDLSTASRHRRRALVVEDNVVNQRILAKILSTLDIDVDVAGDGDVAVKQHGQRPYDVIFMDLQMPVMDGFEATLAIRRVEATERHTPIVGVTANSDGEFRERALAVGMDDFIPKPIQRTVIAEALAKITRDLN